MQSAAEPTLLASSGPPADPLPSFLCMPREASAGHDSLIFQEPQSPNNAMDLTPYMDRLRSRHSRYARRKKSIEAAHGSICNFAEGFLHFGINRVADGNRGSGWLYREWLPAAREVFVVGDFNGWDRSSHPMERVVGTDGGWGGEWAIFLPDTEDGAWTLKHRCKIKIHIEGPDGCRFDRVPAWCPLAWQNSETTSYDCVIWDPLDPSATEDQIHQFVHPRPPPPRALRIYEAHIGIASSEEKIGTYTEFKDTVLPRIVKLGYNTLLLIGIQEHPFYASFGKHVTSYFAPSSRFGNPEELKALIDAAHGFGIRVIFEVCHHIVSPSVLDGVCQLDGSDSSYTVGDVQHLALDCCLFDYKKPEVQRFLLSNLRWFLDRYNIDGFRFAGVNSMVYRNHGIMTGCTDDLEQYFGDGIDEDAVTYLMLANDVVHSLLKDATTIAEEGSGMPVLARPLHEGGLGFDYRSRLSIPRKWAQMFAGPEETWDIERIVSSLAERRLNEPCIVCAENYDVSLTAKRPLKIAIFAWESLHTHAVGGVAPHVTELAAGLSRLGHEVHVFVRATGGGGSESVHYGVHYHECVINLDSDFVKEMDNMCNAFVWFMGENEAKTRARFHICHAHDWLTGKTLGQVKASGHACVATMHSTEFGRCGNNAYGGD